MPYVLNCIPVVVYPWREVSGRAVDGAPFLIALARRHDGNQSTFQREKLCVSGEATSTRRNMKRKITDSSENVFVDYGDSSLKLTGIQLRELEKTVATSPPSDKMISLKSYTYVFSQCQLVIRGTIGPSAVFKLEIPFHPEVCKYVSVGGGKNLWDLISSSVTTCDEKYFIVVDSYPNELERTCKSLFTLAVCEFCHKKGYFDPVMTQLLKTFTADFPRSHYLVVKRLKKEFVNIKDADIMQYVNTDRGKIATLLECLSMPCMAQDAYFTLKRTFVSSLCSEKYGSDEDTQEDTQSQ